MKYIDATMLERMLDLPSALIAVNRSLERNDKAGAHCPPRSLIWRKAPLGVFGTMSGYFPDLELFVVKVAAFVPDGAQAKQPSVNAQVIVINGRLGTTLAVIDGAALTRIKCAALSAYVTDLCAVDGPVSLAIIGCGVQAREQLRAIRMVREIKQLYLCSRTRASADAWSHELRKELPAQVRITVMHNAASACNGADVIATTTTSADPLFADAELALKSHVHINCMGAHTRHSRELPNGLLRRSLLIVEDRETAVREAGEVHANALELPEIKNIGKALREQPTVFSSTGHIWADACIAAEVVSRMGFTR